jgi:N-acetylglutamate synthase-like GNAT family acetyltransferase
MVSLVQWFRGICAERGRFFVPLTYRDLRPAAVRELRDEDFTTCEAIYRANEALTIPAGYSEEFSEWLRNRRATIVVVEANGVIVAFGGVSISRKERVDLAFLTYGVVHPDYQGQGYGTLLLLARLRILPKPVKRWTVMMTTTDTSKHFFSRFGFRFFKAFPDKRQVVRETHWTAVSADWLRACAHILRNSTFSTRLMEEEVRPIADLGDGSPGQRTADDPR